jgi:hypothetical protein
MCSDTKVNTGKKRFELRSFTILTSEITIQKQN